MAEYPYDRLLYNNQKTLTDTFNNMDDFHRQDIEQKKLDAKDTQYMILFYKRSQSSSLGQRWRPGGEVRGGEVGGRVRRLLTKEHERAFWALEMFHIFQIVDT